ncbi:MULTISPECIES: hypothetical protein [Morganellaceae]|uniref:Uncharacterized protein n=3 Tax=Morganellaceae TaxID=1903414 RepID=A0A1B8HCZ2_9GAMM|nr:MULTISPECIES: hypothetical protein [Morganellaceae]OBU06948.1 hypothetical protein AYY17_19615 [Morganella psychrotolerans]QCJ72289.1 hypothetical protein C9446_21060 [Providencia heimbachae]
MFYAEDVMLVSLVAICIFVFSLVVFAMCLLRDWNQKLYTASILGGVVSFAFLMVLIAVPTVKQEGVAKGGHSHSECKAVELRTLTDV